MYTLLNGRVHSNWCGPRGVLLTVEENKTQLQPAIGYLLFVVLCVALSLADIHVIKWQCPLKLVQTAWRTPYSSQPGINGCNPASYTHYPITTYEYENSQILIGRLNVMRRDIVMI